MIETYLTDLIDIKTNTFDEWGAKTSTTQSNIKARLEDETKIVRNKDGQEVASNGYFFIDKDAVLTYDTTIVIKKINDVTFLQDDKEYAPISISKAHGFMFEYWEVWF